MTGIVLIIIALAFGGATIYQNGNQKQLRTAGIEVEANIVDKGTRLVSSGRGSSTEHYITVMYFDQPASEEDDDVIYFEFLDAEITLPSTNIGDFHSDDIVISEQRFDTIQIDTAVSIIYHPDSPEEAWLTDVVRNLSPWDGIWLTAVSTLIGTIFILIALRKT